MRNEIVHPGLKKFRASKAKGRELAIQKRIELELIAQNPDLAKPERAVVLKNLAKRAFFLTQLYK
jgi:hypothetical protein